MPIMRRRICQGRGSGRTGGPFFSLLKKAPAQSIGRQAKYFFIFFTNGTDSAAWTPAGSSETQIQFSAMTSARIRSRRTCLVEQCRARAPGRQPRRSGRAHRKGLRRPEPTSRSIIHLRRAAPAASRRRSQPHPGRRRDAGTVDFWRNGQRLTRSSRRSRPSQTIFSGPEVWRRRASARGDPPAAERDRLSAAS